MRSTMDISVSNTQSQSMDEQFIGVSTRPGKSSSKGNGQGYPETIPLEEYRGETLKKIHAQSSAETSGLEEYRGETLKKIHAQSSAETSGLGDSLQRIHALSSTETSGYGDGDGYYCGTPSPDIGHGLPPLPLEDGEITSPGSQQSIAAEDQQQVKQSVCGDDDEIERLTKTPAVAGSTYNKSGARVRNNRAELTDQLGIVEADQCSSSGNSGRRRSDWDHPLASPHMSSVMRGAEQTGLPRVMSIDAEVSAITSGNNAHHRYHRGSDQLDASQHNNQGTTTSPIVRSESQGSLRGGRGNFLGKNMASTWLKWSQERRISFKRRRDEMEERQKELEEQRVSTPVRKARKESIMFVSSELEGNHVPEDEDLQIHERLQNHMPPSKAKKKDDKEENKLSTYHWNTLVMFWEHPLFIRCRVGGIILGSIALIITIVSLTNQSWSHYQDHDYYGASYSGLWLICSSKEHGNNCTSTFHREWLGGADSTSHWQYAVIGLLIFATAFGFLATMLGICGLCASALPRKLYYYHSAGEIYLICAMSVLAAVLIYPFAIKAEVENSSHRHGLGFILAWVAIFVFDLSALCMCLDEIMRALTKLCQTCDRNSRTRV